MIIIACQDLTSFGYECEKIIKVGNEGGVGGGVECIQGRKNLSPRAFCPKQEITQYDMIKLFLKYFLIEAIEGKVGIMQFGDCKSGHKVKS